MLELSAHPRIYILLSTMPFLFLESQGVGKMMKVAVNELSL